MSKTSTAKKAAVKPAPKKDRNPRLVIVEEGREGTSIAARLPSVLVNGVRSAAKIAQRTDPKATMSSVLREGIEDKVREVHCAAGEPWPPPASEEPALPPAQA